MRILLVEDDLMVGNAMVDSLRDASYAADWVQNGNDAVTSCLTQHYDIVILDLGLAAQEICVECRNTYFLSDIDSVDLKAKNSTCIIRRLASLKGAFQDVWHHPALPKLSSS
ncbi:TPA: hypothetical protein ACRX9Q_000118 [Klebsiella variicola]|uniref:hypothetical protein n=1 Tax=Klebsiella pneumoniae TaxID=573 RepID=UPI002D7748A5|nr:hypothetical protein [Klebsiella pneumoniae]WRP72295.1 hypothetical protein VI613_27115 [Klebsiella pneumoniae]